MIRHVNQRHTKDPNTCLIMKLHKAREATKTQLLALSPNSPISTPPIYLPLWQWAPKRDLILVRWRRGIRRWGRDSLRRLNGEIRGVVLVGVVIQARPCRRSRTSRTWRRWSRTRLGAWSRNLSGLRTLKIWVRGDRGRDLLSDNSKVVILLTQTLSLRCSKARKKRGHPRTG
jgi:hypothetical protein